MFIISAPSGTGKSTIARRLEKTPADIMTVVSHTTRLPRPGEVDGVHYHFVTEEIFQEMIRQGSFLEWASYGGNLYGTGWRALREMCKLHKWALLEIEVKGALQVMNKIDCKSIFIIPDGDPLETLRARIERRGDTSKEETERRLEIAREELQQQDHFAHVVINREGQIEHAVNEILKVLYI